MRPKMVKVCGITRAIDAQHCIELGSDALGFIFHSKSPRNLNFDQYDKLRAAIQWKGCLKVAVAVNPDEEFVRQLIHLGFDRFQFHFPSDLKTDHVHYWSSLVGKENLWLAPRLGPAIEFPQNYLKHTKVFLVDAYSDHAYGGTGQKADWLKFSELKQKFLSHQWFLAGGLGPDNLEEAVLNIQPDGIDINSGVESRPGIKDPSKIDQVFTLLKKLGSKT